MAPGFCLYGQTANGGASLGPLQIKTGPSIAVAGFAAEDLALTFREMFGLGSSFHAVPLAQLGTEVAPWPKSGARSNTVLLFDAAETLESYAKDREHFPYSKHLVAL
jgi:hypothetical protein